VNRELVVDQVDFADAAALRTSLQRVHAYLNIGLEYLSNYDAQQLMPLLTTHSLQALWQVGLTLILRLCQRATHLQTHLNRAPGVRRTLPGLARQVVDGLLHEPPQFFAGLESPGETAYRDFLHVQDISLVDGVLRQLESDPTYWGTGSSD
jgi:hypothetical protein